MCVSYNNEPSLTASFHSGLAIIRRSSEAREGFGKSAKIAIPADTSNIQPTRIVVHTEGARKKGSSKKKKKKSKQGGSLVGRQLATTNFFGGEAVA